MSFAERAALAVIAAALGGACAVSLEDPPDAAPPAGQAPILESCVVLARPPAILGASGRVRTLVHDGALLVVADAIETPAGPVPNAVYTVPAPAPLATCPVSLAPPDGVAPALDKSALDPALSAGFGAVFVADAGALRAFVFTARGLEPFGTTLATWDAERATFVASPEHLFAAGHPTFGEAALVAGEYVYAYGAATSGFLAEDVFVARAPLGALADRTAWRFYRDGNDFGDDPDEAWPIFPGGSGIAVAVRGDGRVLVAYHEPLGDTVLVRVGLGPTGPWSPAEPITRCDLPAGAFCGAIGLHTAGDAALSLTYGVATFDPLPVRERLTRALALP